MDTTIPSDDDIVHMLSNDQLTLTAAQVSALMVQLAAELSKTNYDDESYLDEPTEMITPSETGQGTHKRWVYPPTWDDIMGSVIDSIICDSHRQDTFDSPADGDIPFHLLLPPHSHFDMSPLPDTNPLLSDIFDPSLQPLFSNPFQFSEDLESLMTPRSSSASTSTVGSVPSAPKKPYRTSKGLNKGDNGEMEDGLDMDIDFNELGDDYECLNTPPRLLWERSGSKDLARVAGDDQDDDPFL